MREILFRGKRIDKGGWRYGSLIVFGERTFIYPTNGSQEYYHFYGYEVIPETVVQFTGLTDKNGVKIFEGDVVKMWSKIHIMKFINGCFEFVKFDGRKQNLIDTTECEVIGNIHDNPELPCNE